MMVRCCSIWRLAVRNYRRATVPSGRGLESAAKTGLGAAAESASKTGLGAAAESASSLSKTGLETVSKWPVRRFVKLGALAVTGYLTFVHPLDDLLSKTRPFREAYGYPPVDLFDRLFPDPIKQDSTESVNTDQHPTTLRPLLTPIFVVPAVLLHLFVTARIYIQEILQDNFDLPPDKLLTDLPVLPYHNHWFTLVLDLTDTLVESDWKGYTFLNTHLRSVKRPGLEAFLQRLDQHGFEIVLYTDELTMMTHFFMESFDKNYFYDALTRSTTLYRNGKRYRDLSRLNRDPSRVLYVSAHALENCLQPENCVLIKPWNKEADDTTLADLLAFLEDVARSRPNDVRPILASFKGKDVAAEYRQRCESWMLKAEEERKIWKSRCESGSGGRGMGPVNMMARQQLKEPAHESESESDDDGGKEESGGGKEDLASAGTRSGQEGSAGGGGEEDLASAGGGGVEDLASAGTRSDQEGLPSIEEKPWIEQILPRSSGGGGGGGHSSSDSR